MSKKRIIKVPDREKSYEDQFEVAHPGTEESSIENEQEMDILPEDNPFENRPYEPPAPGEGP